MWMAVQKSAGRSGPAGAERDHAEGGQDGEGQTEARVARSDLLVDLLLADGAADVLVDVFELAGALGRVRLAAGDLGDPLQLDPVHGHRLAPTADLDVAVLGAVGDGVDRDVLVAGGAGG